MKEFITQRPEVQLDSYNCPAHNRFLAVHHCGVPDGLTVHRPPNRHKEQNEGVEENYAVAIAVPVSGGEEDRQGTALTKDGRHDGERSDGLPVLADGDEVGEVAERVAGRVLFELGDVWVGEDQSPGDEPEKQEDSCNRCRSATASESRRIDIVMTYMSRATQSQRSS